MPHEPNSGKSPRAPDVPDDPEHLQPTPTVLMGRPVRKEWQYTPAHLLAPFLDDKDNDKPVSRAEFRHLQRVVMQLLKQLPAKGGRQDVTRN